MFGLLPENETVSSNEVLSVSTATINKIYNQLKVGLPWNDKYPYRCRKADHKNFKESSRNTIICLNVTSNKS